MQNLRRESVELTVISVINDLIQDWDLPLAEPVGAHTTLVKDLEFASVDIIQLCVALEQSFECKLGFQSLLMRDGSYVSDLSVEETSKFIETRLHESAGGSSA